MTAPGLLDWLDAPAPERGIRFLRPDGTWVRHPYPELAAAAHAVAHRLRAAGVRPGRAVALVLGSGPEFVAAFFGTLLCGAVPAPLAPPATFQDDAAYRAKLAAQLAALRPTVILTAAGPTARGLPGAGPPAPGLALRLPPPVAPAPVLDLGEAWPDGCAADAAPVGAPATALVQFTSGSSGPARAVVVSARALAANLAAVRRWLRMGPDDPTATWLPFHHDMGLVGCLLTPVTTGADLWVLRPEDFVRSPLAWLRCFGEHGARLTATPAFGLAHVVRRVRPHALTGLDFGRWRAVITGAERIDPAILSGFVDLLAPHGFRAASMLPAYGLAEATLAVTGVPLSAEPRTLRVDRSTLRTGHPMEPAGPDTPPERRLELVGCGGPLLPDGRIRVVDEQGEELPPGHVGEIVCAGSSIADGYLGAAAFDPTELRTGDSGFRHEGELYVLGRLGDSLKQRARTVFAEDLEAVLTGIAELRHRRPAVLLGALAGVDTAVAVVEGREGAWVAAAVERLRRGLDGAEVVVVTGPSGLIRRTSSGKPRRRPMWEAFAAGTLGGRVVGGTACT
ncbi:AMP-binding protein [Streptomyces sp. SP17BM10]|uniref:AMP-binding protein n=1 Tax=Streptomyces sp. SP17BM10 TaxID=3002530 RepID=UPI002E7932C4|nr:AMP-binding protein [Streptomyces sp. SP17BM10]MEE1784463.1 AMP-binding protein [Streptomyces sp. SP17BM10]